MKKLLVVIGIVVALIVLAFIGQRWYTKSFSPQDTSTFEKGNVKVSVTYSRPYKKGRKIFGELVPYGDVWRTGANEATLFQTTSALLIDGKSLPPGEYSLFTVPGEEQWDVIFNSETGQWGISGMMDPQANRDPEKDVLVTTVPSVESEHVFEQFTIAFESMGKDVDMIMMWDKTMVVVPIKVVTRD